MSDIHLKASHDTHNCIGVLKQAIDSIKEEFKPSFLVSNQKCYSPKLIKYKEVLQKMTAGSEKGGPEIAVDEGKRVSTQWSTISTRRASYSTPTATISPTKTASRSSSTTNI